MISKSGRRLAAAATAGALGATLIGSGTAHAATASRTVLSDGTIRFVAHDNATANGKVQSRITLDAHPGGTWDLDTRVHNSRVTWRNVRVSCTVNMGTARSPITISSPRFRVGGGDTKYGHWRGSEPYFGISLYYRYIGNATCDLHVG